jgi:nickel/cobalt exporter
MSLEVLAITALSLGTFHTVVGVDHYLPFIVLGKSRNWPMKKTMAVTLACGIGHVLSSVLIGLAGLLLGIALDPLVGIEGTRGEIASWSLIVFGLVYGTWGLYRGIKNKPHTHAHPHLHDHEHEHDEIADDPAPEHHDEDDVDHAHVHPSHEHHEHHDHDHPHEPDHDHDHVHEHQHEHVHDGDHVHVHSRSRKELTVWTLFIVFVLGPCEPLIPLVMYEAISFDWAGIAWVTLLFCIATLAVMMTLVFLASKGLMNLRVKVLERYVHAIAGYLIAGSGLTIILFGI